MKDLEKNIWLSPVLPSKDWASQFWLEIVNLPSYKMVIFHSYVMKVYQTVFMAGNGCFNEEMTYYRSQVLGLRRSKLARSPKSRIIFFTVFLMIFFMNSIYDFFMNSIYWYISFMFFYDFHLVSCQNLPKLAKTAGIPSFCMVKPWKTKETIDFAAFCTTWRLEPCQNPWKPLKKS